MFTWKIAHFGEIEHIKLEKGLDMIDKADVGWKKWISQKWLSNETNKLLWNTH